MAWDFCLWLNILGKCSDYYNNEYTIMNIWVLLGVLWIFIAAYQLLNETYKMRLEYKYTWLIILYLLWFSIIICFIWWIMPFIPGTALPLFWYHIFYEILSVVLILISLIIWLQHLFKPIKPKSEKDFGKLLDLTIWYLTKWWKYTDAYISELFYFINDLFFWLINWKKYTNEIFIHLLNRNSIDNIIENNPWTLYKILTLYTDNIQDFSKNNIILEEFFQNIFFSSLANEKSFISRELNEEINKHYKNWFFLDSILWSFKNIHYLWLLDWIPYSINIKKDLNIYYRNFITFFNKSFYLFLDEEENLIFNIKQYYKSIYFWLSQVSWIIQNNYKDLWLDIDTKWLDTHIWYKLKSLNSKIMEIYWNKLPEINYDLDKLSHYLWNDWNLYVQNFLDSIAFWLFDCYLSASKELYTLNEDEQWWKTRSLVMHIDRFLWYDKEKTWVLLEIQKRINFLFESKIDYNLNWNYPMAIKSFFYAYGYQIFTKNDEDNWNDFYKKILKIIAEKLPKLIKWYIYGYNDEALKNEYNKNYAKNKAKKIFEDLFPENMKYNEIENKIYYYYSDNSFWSCIDLNILLEKDIIEIENP